MFKLVLTALLLWLNIKVECGHAAYYAPGVMEGVVRVRQSEMWAVGSLPDELPPVIGFVARPNCGEIGQLVWIYHDGELAGPHLVADCCNEMEGHCKAMERKCIVVEVDFNTAKRWKVLGRGPEHIDVCVITRRQDGGDS